MTSEQLADDGAVADGARPPIGLRERRRSQTRAEIAEAALDLFERQGVAATTVEDIAAAAGISPRTFGSGKPPHQTQTQTRRSRETP